MCAPTMTYPKGPSAPPAPYENASCRARATRATAVPAPQMGQLPGALLGLCCLVLVLLFAQPLYAAPRVILEKTLAAGDGSVGAPAAPIFVLVPAAKRQPLACRRVAAGTKRLCPPTVVHFERNSARPSAGEMGRMLGELQRCTVNQYAALRVWNLSVFN